MKRNDTLYYIKKIADAKSISIAAEQLGISQPALSSYLKKVEGDLDTVLFDRNRQPLELTEAGRVYIDYLDNAAALQKEMVQSLSDIEGLKTGSLTVGGASFFNVAYLPKAIAAFASEYPGIEIEIIDDKVPELVAIAQKGLLDLFITPISDDPDRFIYEELLEEKVYLAVPSDWPVNRKLHNPITAKDFQLLCQEAFIVLKPDQDIGQKMNKLFNKFGCHPSSYITAEQTMTTLALTQNGVGVSLITESSIKNCGMSKLPELYMVDPSTCTRKMYIAYPRNKYLSKAATKFIEILKEKNK